MKLFAIGSAVAWAGLSAFIVFSAPEVTVSGTATCPTAADDWAKALAKSGLDVSLEADAPTDAACPAGKIGGYTLEGAVPAEAVHLLLRKKPSDVIALAVADDDTVIARTTDGAEVPFHKPETDTAAAH